MPVDLDGCLKVYFTNANSMKCGWTFVSNHELYSDPSSDMHRWPKFSAAIDEFYSDLRVSTF